MILRPYQADTVAKAVSALQQYRNTLVVAPTGAGKTIMLSELNRRMKPERTLVLQHRDELVQQNIDKFQRINGGTVSIVNAKTKDWNGQAVFAMVQTLSRERTLSTMPDFDLAIIDEAHHAVAPSYLKILNRHSGMVAGFTATPNRGDGTGLAEVFNNCAGQISLTDLVRAGFLVTPRIFVVDVGLEAELKSIRIVAGEYDMGQVEAILNTQIVNDEIFRHWQEKAGTRKTIIFCSTIAHARSVLDTFQASGVNGDMVTGETPKAERERILRQLEHGDLQVVVNVAVLTEGFDCPPVSCIVLLRPCSFKSTMLQMIGRGLRTLNEADYPGQVKKDCMVLDFGNSCKVHRVLEDRADLEGREKFGDGIQKECGECGAMIPAACQECPVCGYVFPLAELELGLDEELLESVELTELQMLDASPFRWVDLFGYGKVLMASGFSTFALIATTDGETWTAIGKGKPGCVKKLSTADRLQALAMADDFLRDNETSAAADKSRAWQSAPASIKQRCHLEQLGYQVATDILGNCNYSKLSAAAHLNFQWHRQQIERCLGL